MSSSKVDLRGADALNAMATPGCRTSRRRVIDSDWCDLSRGGGSL